MIREYYRLTKPGIIYGNALVAAAVFVYASHKTIGVSINWALGLEMLLGLACIVASACVFNNYLDRDIDAKMSRTKNRALVSGAISGRSALAFAAVLLFAGTVLLFIFANLVPLAVALAGFFIYVFLYTPLKPRTPYALFVGAVAGATPPVVGYTVVTNTLNSTALALFIFLALWQVPHFLAIAVYRNDEYVAAGVPLFVKGPYSEHQKKRARIIFYLSLVVLLAWCFALIVQR